MPHRHFRPWLRDGVDVFVAQGSYVYFVFLATRRRIGVRADPRLLASLEWLDGEATVAQLESKFHHQFPEASREALSLLPFLEYLTGHSIVIDRDWARHTLPTEDCIRFSRQLNFFLDMEGSTKSAISMFRRILTSRIAIFGLGSVGSWIFLELLQLGFRNFILIDSDRIDKFDIARHAFFSPSDIGERKVNVLARQIRNFCEDGFVRVITDRLHPDSNLDHILSKSCDVIVNTADEPYIGATSIKLSRYCVKQNIPLLIAGGFDAHLGCVGELIVPRHTPCADCYANFFSRALRDWNPAPHPIENRALGVGGLPMLSVFSASVSVLKILQLFRGTPVVNSGGRGELLFDNYTLEEFQVPRDPLCKVCGSST